MNLYVYCQNDPIQYLDYSGNFFISTATLLIVGLGILGGIVGGAVGNHIAKKNNVPQNEKWKYILWGSCIGAGLGMLSGYIIAPSVVAATGIAGIYIGGTGIYAIPSSLWSMNPFYRGWYIEKLLGGWCNNCATIDNAGKVVNGVNQSVTSIKSINIFASSYQGPDALYNLMMKYANDLANFVKTTWHGVDYIANETTQRILKIAIPSGATAAQWEQINHAITEAAKKLIEIIIYVIP